MRSPLPPASGSILRLSRTPAPRCPIKSSKPIHCWPPSKKNAKKQLNSCKRPRKPNRRPSSSCFRRNSANSNSRRNLSRSVSRQLPRLKPKYAKPVPNYGACVMMCNKSPSRKSGWKMRNNVPRPSKKNRSANSRNNAGHKLPRLLRKSHLCDRFRWAMRCSWRP